MLPLVLLSSSRLFWGHFMRHICKRIELTWFAVVPCVRVVCPRHHCPFLFWKSEETSVACCREGKELRWLSSAVTRTITALIASAVLKTAVLCNPKAEGCEVAH